MTNEQKVEAYKMLLDGASLKEVGDRFGLTHQRVQQAFPGIHRRGPRSKGVYPNLERWIESNCGTRQIFAKEIGTCYKTTCDYLTEKRIPTKRIIDKILEVTGMTYEEAFKR